MTLQTRPFAISVGLWIL